MVERAIGSYETEQVIHNYRHYLSLLRLAKTARKKVKKAASLRYPQYWKRFEIKAELTSLLPGIHETFKTAIERRWAAIDMFKR